LSGFTLESRAERVLQNDKFKWERRLGNGEGSYSSSVPPEKCKALLPKEFQTFVNLTRSRCKCHKFEILNPEHLQQYHGILVPNYYTILKKIERMIVYKATFRGGKVKMTIDRFASLKVASEYVSNLITLLKRVGIINSLM